VPDVVTGLAELLQVATAPGDAVLIEPPVYPPFAGTARQLGRAVVTAPMDAHRDGLRAGPRRDRARLRRGARVHVLCSPHNPTGVVYAADALAAIAALADRHDVLVLADEIHAPLTLPGATHTPFPMASAAAARRDRSC
jgi:cystathionine beta-lyase